MERSVYVLQEYRDDPLGMMVRVMDLQRHERALRDLDPEVAIYLTTSIMLYRQLRPTERKTLLGDLMAYFNDTSQPSHIRYATSHLYHLAPQMIMNPYWFAWSLSDQELRDHYDSSQDFVSAIERAGIDFEVNLTVVGLATGLFAVMKNGAKGAVKEYVREQLQVKLVQEAGKSLKGRLAVGAARIGVLTAVAVVCANVLYAQSKVEARRARKELIARGIIRYSDL